jgi:hypothetical protein
VSNILTASSRVLEDGDEALLNQPALEDDEQYASLDESAPSTVAAPAEKPAPVAKPDEEDLPEQYRGKTAAQIARMHMEAAQLVGRQGRELGELRQTTDGYIKAELAKRSAQPKPEPKVLKDSDFFAEPRKTVEDLVANHPAVKAAQEELTQFKTERQRRTAQENADKFNNEHGDAAAIMNDPEFQEWVDGSKVRKALLKRANEAYDFDAGNEVFDNWKRIKRIGKYEPKDPTPAAAASTARRAAERKAAGVPTGGNTGTGKPDASGAGKKIFKRAEVVALMQHEPSKYEAMADEIALAYHEGRVR